jgi:hypothetical protein
VDDEQDRPAPWLDQPPGPVLWHREQCTLLLCQTQFLAPYVSEDGFPRAVAMAREMRRKHAAGHN